MQHKPRFSKLNLLDNRSLPLSWFSALRFLDLIAVGCSTSSIPSPCSLSHEISSQTRFFYPTSQSIRRDSDAQSPIGL